MENQKNTDQVTKPNDMAPNETEEESVVYAGLGVNNEPDVRNPGDEEASDTLLYTDSATAIHATNAVSNDAEPDEFTDESDEGDLTEDEMEEEITELGEEENEGNERY